MQAFLILGIAVSMLTSCSQQNKYEARILELANQEKELQCLLASMKDSIGNQWDDMQSMLSDKLPDDVPAEERRNMMSVRNADLIRMFDSYKQMDPTVKDALDEMEQIDSTMARKIMSIKKELEPIEAQKIELFGKMNQDDKEAIERARKLYKEIMDGSCIQ